MAKRREPDTPRDSAATRPVTWKAVPADDRPEVDLLQWIGWLLGGYLVVWGLVALARAGFDHFDLFDPIVSVGVFHATRLTGLIAIALGLIVWFGVAGAADDLGLRAVGAIVLVAGIVFLIEPDGFRQWLGTESVDGAHFAVIGAILVVFSLIPPFKVGRRPKDENTAG
jgi:hypothetical protein